MYPVFSLVALIPCFWQSRIQAGDLASHIYNAWLAQLIQEGKAAGLAIVPQSTNVMFDLMLSAFFNAFGANAAQRIAVSISVLILVWGAFVFCRAAGGRPWPAFPILLALAYGWVFHIGFFNFYLAVGFSLWGMALAWTFERRGLIAAVPLFALAYVAHGLPLVWALAVLGYVWIARRWPQYSVWRFGLGFAAILALRLVLAATVLTRWRHEQITFWWGAEQIWVYPTVVPLVALALAVFWGVQIAYIVRQKGGPAFIRNDLFQVCALTAAGILIIPDWINLPWYKHPLAFLAERMSLPVAISLWALASSAPARRWYVYAASAVALLFFCTLYMDERLLNSFEDAEEALVANLPPFSRVVSAIEMPNEHVNAVTHMVDRVCIGHCYSYANYEPATAQFRIRVVGPQQIVAPKDDDTWNFQAGIYVVKPEDIPLYQIEVVKNGNLQLRSLPPGQRNGLTLWEGLQ